MLPQAHLSLQRTGQPKKTIEWLSLQMNRTAKKIPWLGWSLKNESKMWELAKELEKSWKLEENILNVSSISRFIVSLAEHSIHLSPSERRNCLYRVKNQFKVRDSPY